MLKQGQYAPVSVVEEQIAMIYAGTSGAVDKVPVSRIVRVREGYIEHLRANHADLLEPGRHAEVDRRARSASSMKWRRIHVAEFLA